MYFGLIQARPETRVERVNSSLLVKVEPAEFASGWGMKGSCRALGLSSWKVGSLFIEVEKTLGIAGLGAF